MSKVSEKLSFLRHRNNYRLQDVANYLQVDRKPVSNSLISQYEHGVLLPRINTAAKLAKFYNVRLDYFFDDVAINDIEQYEIHNSPNLPNQRAWQQYQHLTYSRQIVIRVAIADQYRLQERK